jgi:hypothetical protein
MFYPEIFDCNYVHCSTGRDVRLPITSRIWLWSITSRNEQRLTTTNTVELINQQAPRLWVIAVCSLGKGWNYIINHANKTFVLGTRSADKLSAQRLPISILSATIQRSPTFAYTQHCASALPLIGSCASQHHHSRTAGVPKNTSTLGVNTFDTDQTHATTDPSTNPPPLLHGSSTMAPLPKMKSAPQRAGSRAPSVPPYQKLDGTAQSRADHYIQEMLSY